MELTYIFVIIGIVLVCLIPIINLFYNRIGFIEFPVLFSLTVLGWFLPQFLAEIAYGNYPSEAILKSALMAFLCFAGAITGYSFYNPKFNSSKLICGDIGKLRSSLVFMTILFLIPLLMLGQYSMEELQGGWSGPIVILLFFYSALKYTAFFSFLLWFGGDKSKKVLFAFIAGCAFYLLAIIGFGRRADSLEAFFAVTGGLFFIKKIRVPKTVIFIGALVFSIFMANTGQYRSIMTSEGKNKVGQILDIDWFGNFQKTYEKAGNEVGNYIMGVYSIDEKGDFDFGLYHWNSFISHFVPRQLVGEIVKNNLMANITDPDEAMGEYGHEAMIGQTFTGMLDAFHSFWYFGFINFVLIGIFFKYLYLRAKEGLLKHQVFYLFLLTSGLHTITHTSNWCFYAFFHLWLFTLPIRKYSLIPWPPKVSNVGT